MNTTTSPRSMPFHIVALVGLLFFWVPSHAQINFQKSVTRAVVVGISNYQNIPKLRFAHRDAEVFAEYLRSPAGGSIPESQIKLLTNEKATQAQIGAALSWLISESQEGDQVIIYFSGHGDVETQISNLGYLLAFDANKSTYMAGGAIPIFALQSIITSLTVGKQVQVLLIADACHSGNLAGSATGGAKTTALALATQFDKEVKIMSCGADEVSHEGEDWGGGHSVFSYYLLEGLRGLADVDEDRTVSLREIERFLEDSVRRATVQMDRRQTPATYGSKDRIIAKVDAATLAALRQKYSPPKTANANPAISKEGSEMALNSDSAMLQLYQDFEAALRTGHLLEPEKGSAYSIYHLIKDHPSMRVYKNLMRNDLAAKFQDESQKAINDYLSADPREMRKRWGLDDSRYRLYPLYLEKAAELLGEQNIAFKQIKAKQYYFSGLNLRLKGERSKNPVEKDSSYTAARLLQGMTISLDSTAAYAYNELGLLALRLNQWDQAIDQFNAALKFSPTWVLPWVNLGTGYFNNKLPIKAEACWAKALELDSTNALAHYNMGYLFLDRKEGEKATYHFQKTIAYQADYDNAYYNLALSYYDNGKYLDAEQMWQEYYRRNPNDPATLQSLGQVGLDLGKGASYAEPIFLKVISLDSNYSKPYFSLGELALAKKEFSAAEKWFNRVISLSPDEADAYYQLALAQYQNADKSLKSLEMALQKGFKDLERIKTEPRFAAIRNKAGFKALVKQYALDKP